MEGRLGEGGALLALIGHTSGGWGLVIIWWGVKAGVGSAIVLDWLYRRREEIRSDGDSAS